MEELRKYAYNKNYSEGFLLSQVEYIVRLIRNQEYMIRAIVREELEDGERDEANKAGFLKDALRIVPQYPGYSDRHVAELVIFKSTYHLTGY